MFKIFYGENRLEAEKKIKALLGDSYEVFEGENLELTDLPSIFRGTSLFGAGARKILLKEMGANSAAWEKIIDYADTEHEVVVWETKIDKRSAGYKRLKDAGVEMVEFPALKKPEMNLVFGILDAALSDGEKAVAMVEKVESDQDPYMFFGLLVTQALKRYENSGARGKEKRILKELAKLDMQMKTTGVEPWVLVKSFLLRVKDV